MQRRMESGLILVFVNALWITAVFSQSEVIVHESPNPEECQYNPWPHDAIHCPNAPRWEPRWSYNAIDGECVFNWVYTCHRNGTAYGSNQFVRLQACRETCECTLQPVVGRCRAFLRRWYYDNDTNSCQRFIYGGCDGNGNNFHTEHQCYQTCQRAACTLPPVAGRCRAFHRRWYYDNATNSCRRFIYGGCDGNGNNFDTEHQCSELCKKGVGMSMDVD